MPKKTKKDTSAINRRERQYTDATKGGSESAKVRKSKKKKGK
jgi:hypothetical protein